MPERPEDVRPDGPARAVRTYLDHLSVERGLAANTLSSYRRDLRRYLGVPRGSGRSATWTRSPRQVVTDFLVRLREGDADHPALSADLGGPDRGGGARVPQVRGPRRAGHRRPRGRREAARRPPSGCPRRCRSATSRRSWRRPGAAGTTLALRDRALLEVLYGTGARISEAVGLDVDDLDLVDGTVLLRGKGSKERLVPLGSYAAEAVDGYLVRARPELVAAATPGGALFLNSRGGRLCRQSAWAVLVKAAERAGVTKDVSPHTLRHSFATHLLDGGADVRVVQELLGHASVTTTQVYTLVTVDNLREVFATAHPRAPGTDLRPRR